MFVDGTSQFGYMGKPIVELNGSAVPGAAGLAIAATGALSSFSGEIEALKIDNFAVGIKVADAGSNIPANIMLINNSIMSPAGRGIVVFAGANTTTAQLTNNSITNGTGDGIAVLTAGTTDKISLAGNTIHTSGGGAGVLVQGSALPATCRPEVITSLCQREVRASS